MTAEKIDRKKLLEEPDEFLTTFSQLARWSKSHRRALVAGGAGLVVVLVAVIAVHAYLVHRQQAAAEALAPAFRQFIVSLGQPDATEGRQAAAEGLAQVAQSFGATQSGVQARLALASLELGRAEWAKAQAALVALVEEDDLAAPLRPLVHRGLGQAEEGQGRFKEAAEAYAEAARLAGPSLAGLIRLDQARALAAAGDKEAAQKILEALVKATPPDPVGSVLARTRLVALGITPPETGAEN